MAVALTACTSFAPESWHRPGASATDFRIDDGQCRVQAYGSIGSQGGMVAVSIINEVRKACLEGKGWVSTAK